MSVDMLTSVATVAAALTGAGFGRGYFWALRRSTDLYARGGGAPASALLTVGRIGAAVLVFAVTAKAGAAPLLAAAAGFLGARSLAVRAARRSG